MEGKIDVIQSNIADLYQRDDYQRKQLIEVLAVQTNMAASLEDQTNIFGVLQTASQLQDWRIRELSVTVSNLIVSINESHSSSPVASSEPAQTQTPPGQIPASVLENIRATAAAHWPDNYVMQALEIKTQTNAWYQLNR